MLQQGLSENIALAPEVQAELRVALTEYVSAKRWAENAEEKLKQCKMKVGLALEPSGQVSTTIDGVSVSWVFPVQTTLDKKKLLAQGVTMAQIEAATLTTPSKSYLKITLPKG